MNPLFLSLGVILTILPLLRTGAWLGWGSLATLLSYISFVQGGVSLEVQISILFILFSVPLSSLLIGAFLDTSIYEGRVSIVRGEWFQTLLPILSLLLFARAGYLEIIFSEFIFGSIHVDNLIWLTITVFGAAIFCAGLVAVVILGTIVTIELLFSGIFSVSKFSNMFPMKNIRLLGILMLLSVSSNLIIAFYDRHLGALSLIKLISQ